MSAPKPKPRPLCVACQDTKKDSRGNLCHPCVINGRIKVEVDYGTHKRDVTAKPPHTPKESLFE